MSFLILVRHGQSICNLEKRFMGWVDVALPELNVLREVTYPNISERGTIAFTTLDPALSSILFT